MSLFAIDVMDEKPLKNDVLDLVENEAIESWPAHEILSWAVKKFGSRLTVSASFGAPEGMILVDMLHKIDPETRVFVIDTGRLHPGDL